MVTKRRITLSGLISLYAGGALVLLALILGLVMQQSISRMLDDALQDKASALARQLAIISLDSVLTYDYGTLERYVRDLAASQNVIYTRVVRQDGEVLAKAGEIVPAQSSDIVSITEPIRLTGETIGEVIVGYDRRSVDRTVGLLTLAGLVGLVVLTIVLFYLLKSFLRARLVEPVDRLARSVNPLNSQSGMITSLPDNVPEEVYLLSKTFSRLQADIRRHIEEVEQANRLARNATTRLCQEQRLATIGQMAAGLAHSLNTPLGNIIGYAQQGRRDSEENGEARRFEVIERQAEKCSTIVGDLLASARAPETVIQKLDIDQLVRSTTSLIRPVIRDHGVTDVQVDSDGACQVVGDVSALEQVLFNLFNNAAQAGATRLSLKVSMCDNGGEVLVQDNGSGINVEDQGRIFDSFFTTKPAGSGTGLGLYLCRTLIESMHGRIELVHSEPGNTVFRLWLPGEEEGQTTTTDRTDVQ